MKGLNFKEYFDVINGSPQKLCCPKCHSEHVNVQLQQTNGKMKTKKRSGLGKLGRGVMIGCTGGLWGLTRANKESTKITYNNEKIAICQDCGNSWKVR